MRIRPAVPMLPVDALHEVFLAALGDNILEYGDLYRRPLDLSMRLPLPQRSRLYLYNCTSSTGSLPYEEHKVQLRLMGQKAGQRASFDFDSERQVLLVGYHEPKDVFILWDAYLYQSFGLNKYLGVKASTLELAAFGRIVEQPRNLRDGDVETVVAARADHLSEAIVHRLEVTRRRILGG